MKYQILILPILTLLFFSCETKKHTVQEILIPENLKWEKLNTGVSHIDSLRKQTHTGFFVLYEDFLVYGEASIHYYTDIDSISIVYEAGTLEFQYLNCVSLEKGVNDTIMLMETPLYFNSKELVYSNKTFVATNKMFCETIKDLNTAILHEVKHCKQ